MTTSSSSPSSPSPVDLSATWERPALATGKGEAHLVVRVSARRTPSSGRAPIDLSLVVDHSGSMGGDKLALAKIGVRTALDLLRPEDRAGLVAYDHEVSVLAPLSRMSSSARHALEARLDRLETGGSTDLFGGWTAGCASLASGSDDSGHDRASGPRVRRTLLLTDGLANVGTTDPREIIGHATQLRLRGISTSTLGVGEGFDEALLTGMAEGGGGNFQYVAHAREMPAFFAHELGELLSVSARDARLTLTLPRGLRATLVNPYPVEREGKALAVRLGDLPAGLTLSLVFSVTGRFVSPCTAPPLGLGLDWAEVESDTRRATTAGISPLRVVAPAELDLTVRDDGASEQVARMLAEQAKREAITHYRAGRHDEARGVLNVARSYAMRAPLPTADTTVHELEELILADPIAPAFDGVRRQTLNAAHRRARGREA